MQKKASVEILELNDKLEGVGIFNEKKIVVKNALPNESVTFKIIKETKNIIIAETKEIISESLMRNDIPICENSYCPGCELSYIKYQDQLELKKKLLKETLLLEKDPIMIENSEIAYRNKIVLPFTTTSKNNDLSFKIGLFNTNSNVISNQKSDCSILDPAIQSFIKIFKKSAFNIILNDLSYLFVRCSEQGLLQIGIGITNIKHEDTIKELLVKLQKQNTNVVSLFYYFIKDDFSNSTIVKDPIFITEQKYLSIVENKNEYKVLPQAFFQLNFEILRKIQTYIAEYFINELNDNLKYHIFDICSGVGILSQNLISKLSSKINCKQTLVEISAEAFTYLEETEKCQLLVGDINSDEFHNKIKENLLNSKKNLEQNVIILDPPRKGVGQKTMNILAEYQPEYIIYLSCNPATQTKDLQAVNSLYSIEKCYGFDMFPNTKHIESLVILKKL